MNVTREVIVDLLPIYMSGEASPASRALVEDYLRQDPELAQRIRLQWAENLKRAAPSGLPPELELRSLKRTRTLLSWQKFLFGFALFFTAIGLSIEFSTRNGQYQEFHFMMRNYPAPFGAALVFALLCWISYFLVRHRVRAGGF